MIWLSGPVIARLALHTRKWAHAHLRRGSFGPVVERGGVIYAGLAGVEQHIGKSFSPDQLMRAAAGRLDHVLNIPEGAYEEA
jgi:hypothetical protein